MGVFGNALGSISGFRLKRSNRLRDFQVPIIMIEAEPQNRVSRFEPLIPNVFYEANHLSESALLFSC